jgi:glycosyltransferase involved in cell wall biosynthesis
LLKTRPKATKKTEIIGTAIDIPENLDHIVLDDSLKVDDPYILYVGRIEPAKGVNDLVTFFLDYKKQHPGKLKLVLVGNRNNAIEESEDVIHLGPIYDDQKFVVMNRAQVLINPSAFESFSLVIAEAWLAGTPTLVNAECSVLEGQSKRANAGLWYRSFAEFSAMLTILLENKTLRDEMAENGRKYIHANYTWPIVEKKYNRILEKVTEKKS